MKGRENLRAGLGVRTGIYSTCNAEKQVHPNLIQTTEELNPARVHMSQSHSNTRARSQSRVGRWSRGVGKGYCCDIRLGATGEQCIKAKAEHSSTGCLSYSFLRSHLNSKQ